VYNSDNITAVAGVDMGAGASLFLKRIPILLLRIVSLSIVIMILSSAARSSHRTAQYRRVVTYPALLVHNHLVRNGTSRAQAEAEDREQVVRTHCVSGIGRLSHTQK